MPPPPVIRDTPTMNLPIRNIALRLAGACLAAWLVAGPAAAQDRVRIALLPMVVHSSEPPTYLRNGLSDMMSARLQRIEDFEVVVIDDPKKATTSLAKALETGRKAQAEFVLFGSFTRFGKGASLDVQCAGATPAEGQDPLREIFVHSGSIGDVIPDLDDLVGKVARFVIADYSQKITAETGQEPDLPSTRAIKQLQDRVAALEAAIARMGGDQSQTEGVPAEVAGGP